MADDARRRRPRSSDSEGQPPPPDYSLVASALRTTFFSPFFTMKVRLQTQAALRQVRLGVEPSYSGWIEQVKRLPDRFGWRYFWRGNAVYFAARCASAVLDVFFGVYINTRLQASRMARTVEGRDGALMVAALSSGLLGSVIFYPFEHYRTRVAMDPEWGFASALQSPRGPLSLFDGFLPYLISVATHRFTSLMVIGTLTPGKRPKRYWQYFVTTLVAFALAYPFEVVSRRLQIQSGDLPGRQLYTGTIDCLLKMVRTEGVSALYNGFAFNVLFLLFPTPPSGQS